MEIPALLKGDSLTRLLQGALFGAVAVTVAGFGFGGWTLGSTAEKMTEERVTAALVMAYAPVCVQRYNADATDVQRAAFKEESKWSRDGFIEKTGFATTPGSASANESVADACAEALTKLLDAKAEVTK